ncbi:hypothetical protein ACRE_075970 [Hapsidospora chrysogenum ATCC 11550]|uniref:Zn(2)-C6 fungal-type domain-containing protein n=1 Tax=Hapsidospora chrysogenum (strain ATCC 11550 / CBS 779.69 / DSM 880 / IAM 14645 / JCM 23072 / IMI 49137) TaxID=857340 RepID=A0A086SX79_HAPC1|nr:hypothetical protein ACRE_075970 [Hapsidospora chrysogenum ATCC 11550]
MVTAVPTASPRGSDSHSPMEETAERAHRACEKCTRTKKKCDKALPACSRCVRLAAACCYEYVFTAPTTAVVDPSTHSGSPNDHPAGLTRHSLFDPDLDIPASMLMSLLSSRGVSWPEAVDLYFQTTNLWLSAVHQERFAQRLEGLGPNDVPQEPQVALLIVCMHLVTQYADSGRPTMPDGTEMLSLPAYVVAKRTLGLLRATSPPSIVLVQCSTLLCLYEFGHGDFTRAYITVGDAYTTAKFVDVRPGKYVETEKNRPVHPEEDERRDLYWALLIVDRLIRVERRLVWKAFNVPSPTDDDLLPTTNIVWDHQAQGPVRTVLRHPAGVSPTVTLGAFQRNCQCAILFTRALTWEAETYHAGRPPGVDSFAELDIATRALVQAMVTQASTWGEYYECFATCTCLLLLLYCSYLCTIDAANIHSSTSNVEVLKAIAGINFTIRIIADTTTDLNEHLARRPALLATCSPVTPFSAYHSLAALSNFEHVIPEADARFHDIYSSLHFFAKRWGVAGQLVNRIESFLATKDEEGTTLDFSFQSRAL